MWGEAGKVLGRLSWVFSRGWGGHEVRRSFSLQRDARAGWCWRPSWTHFLWPEKGSLRTRRVRKMSYKLRKYDTARECRERAVTSRKLWHLILTSKTGQLRSWQSLLGWAQSKQAGGTKGIWGMEQRRRSPAGLAALTLQEPHIFSSASHPHSLTSSPSLPHLPYGLEIRGEVCHG